MKPATDIVAKEFVDGVDAGSAPLTEATEIVEEIAQGKHPRYAFYRASGIDWMGAIPRHWSVQKLKYVANVRTSNVDKKSFEGEEPVQLCNYVDVYYNNFITSELDFMRATAKPSEIERFHLKRGDVLITKDSETPDDIAVPALVDGGLDSVVCGYHLAQIRPIPSQILGEYLFRAISSHSIRDQFHMRANGITRFGLSRDAITRTLLALPSIDEQKAIAAFLRKETARIDELIAKKERFIELLQEKRTALISHAVTKGLNSDAAMKDSGVEWLGQVPEHWKLKKVKFLTRILRGKFTHRPRNEPRMYDGPYPFIQTGDVATATKYICQYHQTLSEDGFRVSKQFPKGTLVMTIAANIGDMAILDFEACFPDSIVGFVPLEGVDLDFLYNLFIGMREALLGTATLNTQLNLNIERIGSLAAVLPPLPEQQQIVKAIDLECFKLEELLGQIRMAVGTIKEYRSALISAAVTGKIDVRNTGMDTKQPEYVQRDSI